LLKYLKNNNKLHYMSDQLLKHISETLMNLSNTILDSLGEPIQKEEEQLLDRCPVKDSKFIPLRYGFLDTEQGTDGSYALKYDKNQSSIFAKVWMDYNEKECFASPLHRLNDRPAVVFYSGTEKLVEMWLVDGQKRRGGGQPCVVRYDLNGEIVYKEWQADFAGNYKTWHKTAGCGTGLYPQGLNHWKYNVFNMIEENHHGFSHMCERWKPQG
jgi:hypothetical protein